VKLMLVILAARAQRGGAERYTRDLAAGMLARGLDVVTAATEFDEDWPGRRALIPTRGLTRSGRYRAFLDGVDAAIAAEPHAVVHAMLPVRRCHLYHPHAGIAATPKRCRPLDALNRRRRAMADVETALLHADNPPLTLALSNYVLGLLRAAHPDAPATVLLNGVDTARFDPTRWSHERPTTRADWGAHHDDVVLLCVAQDFARKGVPTAIRAVAAKPDLPLRLVVIGRDDPAPLIALARKLGVERRVLFPGPTSNPCPAYAAADLFVFPTRHDPCPLVTIEALAMGLPVISTVFNGACDWMTPPLQGAVLPSVDPDPLAQAIQEFAPAHTRIAAAAECLKLRPHLDVQHHYDRLGETYHGHKNRLSH
jgi:UDP-glucose:(heptosyl)LPS alpha-1,3-glucosyltransferase